MDRGFAALRLSSCFLDRAALDGRSCEGLGPFGLADHLLPFGGLRHGTRGLFDRRRNRPHVYDCREERDRVCLHLLAAVDQALLWRRDAFLLFNALLYALDLIKRCISF